MKDGTLEYGARLRTSQVFTLALGTIIGVGWITVLGSWLTQAGSLGSILAFLTGGALLLPVGLCYARVSTIVTDPGGEIAYARAVFGPKLAFVAGWILLFAYIAVCAFEAVSLGWVLSALFPQLQGPPLYSPWGEAVSGADLGIGLAGLLTVAFVNWIGPEGTGRFSDYTVYGLIASAVLFIAAALTLGSSENLRPLFSGDGREAALAGYIAVLVTTPFWFAGFNTAAQAVAAELRSGSARKAGFAVVAAIVVSTVFYCVVIAAASAVAPRAYLLQQDLPAAAAFEYALGPFSKVVLIAGVLGILSTFNAVFFAAVRVLMSLTALRRGRLRGLPQRPTTWAVVTCLVLSLAIALRGRVVILPVVNATGICFMLMFALVSLAALKLPAGAGTNEQDVFALPGGRLTAMLALIISAGLLTLAGTALWTETGPAPEAVVLVLWIVAGAVLSSAVLHNRD